MLISRFDPSPHVSEGLFSISFLLFSSEGEYKGNETLLRVPLNLQPDTKDATLFVSIPNKAKERELRRVGAEM